MTPHILPLLFLTVFLFFPSLSRSFPTYPARLPNGDASSRANSGIDCLYLGHDDCVPGAPRNQFGLDFARLGREWNEALCNTDSDGDGLTNGEELGDPCCTWTPTNGATLRTVQLSHPGDPSSTNTLPKGCPGNGGALTSIPIPTSVPTLTSLPSLSSMAQSEEPLPTISSQAMLPPPPLFSTSALPSLSSLPFVSVVVIPPSAPPSDVPSSTNQPLISVFPTLTPNPPVCFPGSSLVLLDTGSFVTLHNLSIGDRVLVSLSSSSSSSPSFSTVFAFTHRVRTGDFSFTTLRTRGNMSLTLTAGHYVYANGKVVKANDVKVGDSLQTIHGIQTVHQVKKNVVMKDDGLYNPQTLHGDIVVNGVLATTYTEAVKVNAAHALLMPARVAYNAFGSVLHALEKGSERGYQWVPPAWKDTQL